ncbi:glucose-1-phosphate thymidylyltransferase RfbA [Flavobacteriaceae bacterium]|nr:glucose-1-phosphate thymidylyltransferase RfbA [Flavobacteriaceae bacterium]
MKGIILAGGSGTRLYPLTKVVSKQLLPIHDKPMIYYPLSVLMLAGIRDILIISTPNDLPSFISLLGDGSNIGIKISYAPQHTPDGLAQAFIIGEEFIGDSDVCLILGDNIFYGAGLKSIIDTSLNIISKEKKAVVFGYYVNDPERYGIVDFEDNGDVKSIDEKPKFPKSNFAVVGLYFYPNSVINIAKNIKPSKRGELEITTLNQKYLKTKDLKLQKLSRGFVWIDAGTHESITEATEFVKTIEKRTGLKVACIEEIALKMGLITNKELYDLGIKMKNSAYGDYLINISKIQNV